MVRVKEESAVKDINYAILGGDQRYNYLYCLMREQGFKVSAFHVPGIDEPAGDPDEFIARSDAVILPLPIDKSLSRELSSKGVRVIDYYDESLQLMNAIPTALSVGV